MARVPIAAATLKGYQVEGARTNRCLHSQDFSNAVWVSGGGGIAVTPNSTTAPDGTTTADTLTASGANGTLIQDLGTVASAAKTFSIYLKRKTGTGNIDLTMDGGSTWETVAVTGSWVRFTKTQTVADEDVGIRIVTSGDEVYAWGAQVETASFASSYIPTTTVAVTRNADVLTYANTGNIDLTVGTAYAQYSFMSTGAAAVGNSGIIGGGTGHQRAVMSDSATQNWAYDGVNLPSVTVAGANAVTSIVAVATTWGGSAMRCYRNGTAGTATAFDGSLENGSSIAIGSTSGAGFLYGNIKTVKIYGKVLSAAQVAAL